MRDMPTQASLFAALQEHLDEELKGTPQGAIAAQPINKLINALADITNVLQRTVDSLEGDPIEEQRNAISTCVAHMGMVDEIVSRLTSDIAKGGMVFLASTMEADAPYANKMVDLFTGPESEGIIREEIRRSIVQRAQRMDAERANRTH
jgi:hypothetical protein